MGVYIKGLEMPKSCAECRYLTKGINLISLDYKYDCINGAKSLLYPNVYENIAFDCPLIDVQEPHGRLIDADKAVKNYAHYGISHPYDAFDLDDIIAGSPTVIEGSEE